MKRRLACLAAALLLAGCGKNPSRSLPPGQFSIATYNVNAGAPGNLATLEAIRQLGADIVCLQEVSEEWRPSIRERLGAEYPHVLFSGSGYGGMAILSRWPVKETGVFAPPVEGSWFPGWLVEAETPAGTVQVLNVHLRPNWWQAGPAGLVPAPMGAIRKREVQAFYPRLKEGVATIILGDFNEGDAGQATAWLKQNGLADALSQFDAKSHTWRGEKWRINLEARVDRILYSGGLRCRQAEVAQAGESDHLPVKAIFSR